jgi:predicted PurR-regulated permease PerM
MESSSSSAEEGGVEMTPRRNNMSEMLERKAATGKKGSARGRSHGGKRETDVEHDLLAVPLLILAAIGIVFVLYSGKGILVPFVISGFFVYLLRPFYLFLISPFADCCPCCCPREDFQQPYLRVSGGVHSNAPQEHSSLLPPQGNNDLREAPHDAPMRPSSSSSSSSSFSPTSSSFSFFACPPRRLPIILAVLVTVMVAISVIVGIVMLIVHSVQSFERSQAAEYEEEALRLGDAFSQWMDDTLHVDGSHLLALIETEAQNLYSVTEFLQATVLFLFDTVSLIGLVMLFILYLLPEQTRAQTETLRGKIDSQITRYIVLKTLISLLAAGFAFLIQGLVFDLPMAFLFASLTFLFNFIPKIGAVIASLLPLPFIVLDPHLSDSSKVLCFSLPVCVHMAVGNWIEPTVFGDHLELHPITVLLSLAFWFALWVRLCMFSSLYVNFSLSLSLRT